MHSKQVPLRAVFYPPGRTQVICYEFTSNNDINFILIIVIFIIYLYIATVGLSRVPLARLCLSLIACVCCAVVSLPLSMYMLFIKSVAMLYSPRYAISNHLRYAVIEMFKECVQPPTCQLRKLVFSHYPESK